MTGAIAPVFPAGGARSGWQGPRSCSPPPGLYALIAGRVAARTGEIGLRMALGARQIDVLRDVVGRSARLAALGLGAGVLGSLALSRALAGLLFEVRPDDPETLIVTTCGLGLVAILASLVPALRAARVDPASALRAE